MELSTLPEHVVVETTEHKCLQSQFSVLYNEAMQLKTQLEEARNQLQVIILKSTFQFLSISFSTSVLKIILCENDSFFHQLSQNTTYDCFLNADCSAQSNSPWKIRSDNVMYIIFWLLSWLHRNEIRYVFSNYWLNLSWVALAGMRTQDSTQNNLRWKVVQSMANLALYFGLNWRMNELL